MLEVINLGSMYKSLAETLVAKNILNYNQGTELVRLAEVLQVKVVEEDLASVLATHPADQTISGFLLHQVDAQLAVAKDTQKQRWYVAYDMLKSNPQLLSGRFSKDAVDARMMQDLEYVNNNRLMVDLAGVIALLNELHQGFLTRARLLEQLSNNSRQTERFSMSDER